MIAVLTGYGTYWNPAGALLLVNIRSVPFAVPAYVCCCHWLTFTKSSTTGLLTVVQWDA
jgi:hypothetical protein